MIWSPDLEASFGLPPSSVSRTFDDFERLLHPDDRSRVVEIIGEAVRQRSAFDMERRILRSPHREEIWVAVTGQVLPDTSGQPRQITGVIFDITERKRSETVLQQSEAQLRTITDALPGLIAYVTARSDFDSSTRPMSGISICLATASSDARSLKS